MEAAKFAEAIRANHPTQKGQITSVTPNSNIESMLTQQKTLIESSLQKQQQDLCLPGSHIVASIHKPNNADSLTRYECYRSRSRSRDSRYRPNHNLIIILKTILNLAIISLTVTIHVTIDHALATIPPIAIVHTTLDHNPATALQPVITHNAPAVTLVIAQAPVPINLPITQSAR